VIQPASPDLRIRFEQCGAQTKAELSGRITIDSSPEFRGALLRSLRDCQRLELEVHSMSKRSNIAVPSLSPGKQNSHLAWRDAHG